MSLHADICVPARDRLRLERLCRYGARSPLSTKRLTRRDDGQFKYRLRHRWRDGTTHMLFEGIELVERLAALTPPPRFHTVRYHGILAPAASCRDDVVPAPCMQSTEAEDDASIACCGSPTPARDVAGATPVDREAPAERHRRLSWSQLMQRVFAVDVLECPCCRGRIRILAAITSSTTVRSILECMGLAALPPPALSETQADSCFVFQRL